MPCCQQISVIHTILMKMGFFCQVMVGFFNLTLHCCSVIYFKAFSAPGLPTTVKGAVDFTLKQPNQFKSSRDTTLNQ